MDEQNFLKRKANDLPADMPKPKQQRVTAGDENPEEIKEVFEQLISLLSSPACRQESLNLSRNFLNDERLKSLSEAIAINTSLKELNLSEIRGTGFSKTGILALAKALRSNNTIKTLIIDDIANNIHLREIIPFLADNQTLIELSIGNNSGGIVQNSDDEVEWARCGIGEEGARFLEKILLLNTTLKKINLERNNLRESAGIIFIAPVFSENTPLEEVLLGYNHIGDGGVEDIAYHLKTNTKLKILDLRCNNIGNKGAQNIIDMLEVNNTIIEIKLDENDDISEENLKKIKEKLMSRKQVKQTTEVLPRVSESPAAAFFPAASSAQPVIPAVTNVPDSDIPARSTISKGDTL